MLDKVWNFITSLRLTVACLVMALVLVFIGTLAQVKIGLWEAQESYFRSFFIYWSPGDASWGIPVFPGGYAIGSVLLVNLIAAHIRRFKFSWTKSGIFLTHIGLILLLLGQLLTEIYQVESYLRLEEGQARNYSESQLDNELVFIDKSDPQEDRVVSIPDSRLISGKVLSHQALPFEVEVEHFHVNSEPVRNATGSAPKVLDAPDGVGTRLQIEEKAPTYKMDDRNIPTARVRLTREGETLGTFLVSSWISDRMLSGLVMQQFGGEMAGINQPQTFEVDGRTWQLALRFTRYYVPYTIQLLDFTHDRYKGTDVPKNFSSRIHLSNPETGEERDDLIYMNNPLRYAGLTYYQGGFEPGDTVSILQVVRNPVWLTPYISCSLVGLGLLVQFLMHLVRFGKRKGGSDAASGPKEQKSAGRNRSGKSRKGSDKPDREPAVAAVPRTQTKENPA